MSQNIFKNQFPFVVLSLVAIYVIFTYFFQVPPEVSASVGDLTTFGAIIASFGILLGTVALTRYHVTLLYRRKGTWKYSIVTLFILAVTLILGVTETSKGREFLWIFNWVYQAIYPTLYSTTALFITSAAYRTFKLRTIDSGIMMIVAVLMILSWMTLGNLAFPPSVPIGDWILKVPNNAGFRGMTIGVALGLMGIGIRAILGRYREILTA
jgi:hypothetical protein